MSISEANHRDAWSKRVEEIVRQAIMQETKLPAHQLASDTPFEEYGIESVMVVAITRRLEETFGELAKTLFFEFQTLRELANHLAGEFPQLAAEAARVVASTAAPESVVAVQTPDVAVPCGFLLAEAAAVAPNPQDEPIAIIGMSGRFPMANNLDEFWANLVAGKNCISEVPAELWDWREIWTTEKGVEGKSYTRWGGFMNDVDKFDPLFFNISNLEAQSLDPQERLFLETVYHTIEDAGYAREQLAGRKVGVYAGAMWSQYQLYGVDSANAGSSYGSIANRVSYWFNFTGPSIGLDTMCSSSLTTVHLACESLRRGETELAIAGGVNVTVHPNKYLFLSKTGFASTEGLCRAYGEGGDGYVPGDGVGALLLKPLSVAQRDGDRILALIRGSAINHGGKSNAYTVPNPKLQASLIKEALKAARVDPRTISYLEGHGTGTALGDPIEVRALTQAFSESSDEVGYCALGSVKSNVGHLESAAGFAGIAKVVLQMRHRQLVPSIHTEVLNKNIDFDKTPFVVQRTLAPWRQPVLKDEQGGEIRVPRRAGVSSFGAGGANGHVILEEYVEPPKASAAVPASSQLFAQLFVFSAKNNERLQAVVQRFLANAMSYAPVRTGVGPTAEEVLAEMLTVVAGALGVSARLLDADDAWADLSIDFWAADRIARCVNEAFETALTSDDVLRAGTVEQLCVLCADASVASGANELARFANLAYTLQVGREAQAKRLAVEADNFDQLRERLERFLAGVQDIDGVSLSPVSNHDLVQAEGEQDQEFLRSLARSRKWTKLARLWCHGASVPWADCHRGSAVRRVDLPLYPFAKERCWVNSAATAKPAHWLRANQGDPVMERMFYRPEWVEQTLPPDEPAVAHETKGAVVLVYPSTVAFVAEGLKKRLNQPVHEIVLGGKTAVLSARSWSVALADEAALPACAQHLGAIDTVYFLGGVNIEHWHPRSTQELRDVQTASTTMLLRLVKAIEAQNAACQRWSLRIVSNAVAKIADDDVIQPFTASLLGFAKALTNELPHVATQWIDLALGEGVTALTPELRQDLDHVIAGVGDGQQRALRGGKAYRRTLRPASLPPPQVSAWRDDGVYVIIGGAGNVGIRISQYLAERCGANVAWIGRRVANDDMQATCAEVDAQPGRVRYYQADIGDDEELAKALQKIEAEMGTLRGVFHSAMAFSGGRLATLTEAEFNDALHAKTIGSHALYRALKGRDLDFLMFFSSGEAFVGNKGWGAYTVACNFQDAFSLHLREETGWPVHVINWGFWEGNDRGDPELLRAKGIFPLSVEQGGQAIERLLASGLGQVMALNVSDAVLERMGVELPKPAHPAPVKPMARSDVESKAVEAVREAGKVIEQVSQQAKVAHVEAALTVDAVACSVRAIVADTLMIEREKIDLDADLSDFGVDSLIVVNLHRALEELAGTLPATLFLSYSSVREVAEFLINNHVEQARRLLGGAGPTTDELSDRVRVLRRIPVDQIESFLFSYGDLFREGKLATAETSAMAEVGADALLHLLVEVPSCPQIEVFVTGEGSPLLLMPAVALTAPVWLKQLGSLRTQHRLIVIHAPGYGLSKAIRESNVVGVSRVFSEVLQRLIGAQPAHLVSSCFGSIAAAHLARFHPEQVASLSMVGGFYDGADLPPVTADNLSIEEVMQMIQTVSGSLKLDFDTVAAQWSDDDPRRVEAERMGGLLISSQCANPLVAMRYLNEMITLSTLDWVREIRRPVNLMFGDLDTVIRPVHSQTMHEALAGSGLVEIKGSGHYPFLTHPVEFDDVLTRFVNQVDAAHALATTEASVFS